MMGIKGFKWFKNESKTERRTVRINELYDMLYHEIDLMRECESKMIDACHNGDKVTGDAYYIEAKMHLEMQKLYKDLIKQELAC